MPQLDEEAIEEIREDYAETGSIEKTAQNTGRAKDTVQKYTDDMRNSDSGRFEAEEEESDDNWTGTPPSETPFSSGGRSPMGEGAERVDYSSMGPGEFIDHFFDELDMGVKTDFAQMLSRMAELRGEIPDGDQLSLLIQQHGSGIGNANDANMIAEIYDDMADKYLSEKGLGGGPQSAFGQRGQWQQPGGRHSQGAADGGMMGQNPGQGSWSSVPSQDPNRPQGQAGPAGGSPTQGQNPQMGQQMGQQGMFQMFQQMMDQMRQQQQQMMEKFEEMSRQQQQSQDSGGDDMISQMERVLQMREMLEQMDGGGNDGDEMERMVQQFQRQVQSLQEQIQQDGGQSPMDAGDPRMSALVELARDQDMNMERLNMLADTLGMDSDPEIKKAQIEKEIQENKSERRQEMLEEGISALGEVANDLVESGLDTVVGPSNVDNPTQKQQQPQQEQAEAQQAQPQQQEQQHPQQEQPEGEATGSPMREKYADSDDDGGADGGEDDPRVAEEATEADEQPQRWDDETDETEEPEGVLKDSDLYDLGYGIIDQQGYKTTDFGAFVSDMTENGATREEATEVWTALREDDVVEKGSRTAESNTAADDESGGST